MGLFSLLRVAFGTARAIRHSRKHVNALAELPMPDFIPRWVESMSSVADVPHPALRSAVPAAYIAEAEQRLAARLPDELKALYAITDGIDWSAADYHDDFVRIADLKPSAAYSPSLSEQLRGEWERYGRDDGEPEGLTVFSESLVKIMTNKPEFMLPFDDVDDMLALEAPASGNGVVIVSKSHRLLPVGTVLGVENLSATRYGNIRSWLASATTAVTLSKAIASRTG